MNHIAREDETCVKAPCLMKIRVCPIMPPRKIVAAMVE